MDQYFLESFDTRFELAEFVEVLIVELFEASFILSDCPFDFLIVHRFECRTSQY